MSRPTAPILPAPRVCSSSSAAAGVRVRSSEVPHFIIDLSLPPSQRWNEIVRLYSPYWGDMVKHMWAEYEQAADEEESEEEEEEPVPKSKKTKKTPLTAAARAAAAAAAVAAAAARRAIRVQEHIDFASALAMNLLANFRREGLAEYAEELESVSATSGISVADLVLLNLSYEAHGGCTSIVASIPVLSATGKADDHVLMLGRTLDWQHEQSLRQLTVELSFMRDGKLLYRATSFAGFLAIFTAHVPNAYAVAVNFRQVAQPDEEEEEEEEEGEDGDESMDDSSSAATPFAWPVGFLVRHTLECCSDYTTAIARLQCAPLMSPAYFIVCGVRGNNQAIIITRDTELSVRPMTMDTDGASGEGSVTAVAAAAASSPAAAAIKGNSKSKKSNSAAATTAASSSSASAAAAFTSVSATPVESYFDMMRSYLPGSAAAAAADSSTSSSAAATSVTSASSTNRPAASLPTASAIRALPVPIPSAFPWLIQANMDHWLRSKRLDDQESLPRTRLAQSALLAHRDQSITEDHMWKLLAANPIWDEETIYATISIPAMDRFVTLLENPYPPPKTKKGQASAGKVRRKKH